MVPDQEGRRPLRLQGQDNSLRSENVSIGAHTAHRQLCWVAVASQTVQLPWWDSSPVEKPPRVSLRLKSTISMGASLQKRAPKHVQYGGTGTCSSPWHDLAKLPQILPTARIFVGRMFLFRNAYAGTSECCTWAFFFSLCM